LAVQLDAAARAAGLRKLPGLPDFDGLGLRSGDIGIAFWKQNTAVSVYGDAGLPNAVGEDSIKMADLLGIPWDPRVGGFNDRDIHDMGRGVINIVFAGSSDLPPGKRRT
jgi:hypothetical protein